MAEDSKKIFALKQIRLEGRDEEAASGFIDEITLLQRLRGNSNIIQLIDAEVSKLLHCLYTHVNQSFQPYQRNPPIDWALVGLEYLISVPRLFSSLNSERKKCNSIATSRSKAGNGRVLMHRVHSAEQMNHSNTSISFGLKEDSAAIV